MNFNKFNYFGKNYNEHRFKNSFFYHCYWKFSWIGICQPLSSMVSIAISTILAFGAAAVIYLWQKFSSKKND